MKYEFTKEEQEGLLLIIESFSYVRPNLLLLKGKIADGKLTKKGLTSIASAAKYVTRTYGLLSEFPTEGEDPSAMDYYGKSYERLEAARAALEKYGFDPYMEDEKRRMKNEADR